MTRTGGRIALGISTAMAVVTGGWATKEVGLDPPWGLDALGPTPGPEAVA